MKIYVYAISKNEEKFARRWAASMAEADGIFVLDTGSTDGTVELLRSLGVSVTQEVVTPWRFDTARNMSLKLVPDDGDICVCVDIDEVFRPGWRRSMEEAWTPGTRRLTYRYTWSFNPDGTEGVVFWSDKAHSRHGFRWVNPVHEVLEFTETGGYITREAAGVQLDHRPDPSKSRSQYLPLLELSVMDNPQNDRNMHYLGREYMFHGRWKECRETLLRHLAMPSATWRDERCASMRYIARSYAAEGNRDEALSWLYRAVGEAPYLREPYIELAQLLLEQENFIGALYFARCALAIKERGRSYINEAESWGSKPYDIAALASYYLGLYDKALSYGRKALAQEPGNERLAKNMKFYEDAAE